MPEEVSYLILRLSVLFILSKCVDFAIEGFYHLKTRLAVKIFPFLYVVFVGIEILLYCFIIREIVTIFIDIDDFVSVYILLFASFIASIFCVRSDDQ